MRLWETEPHIFYKKIFKNGAIAIFYIDRMKIL